MKQQIIILSVILLGVYSNCYAQKKISRKDAIEDIDFFFEQAEQIHPNLYFNISKEELNNKLLTVKEQLDDSISIDDFSLKMTTLANLMGDGHTNIYPSKNLRDRYREENTQLPFRVNVSNNKIYVASSQTAKLISNDIILSINNVPAPELLALKKLVNGDIANQKIRKLSHYFSYYLFIGYGYSDSLNITVERKGIKKHLSVNLFKPGKRKAKEKYTFRFLNDTTGLLTINTFSGINKGEYLHFLDCTFNNIHQKQINTLLIDLTKNGGGNSYYGEVIFPYINVEKYRFNQKYFIKTSKPEKKYIRKRFVKWYYYPLYPFVSLSKMGRILLFKKSGSITEIALKDTYLNPVANSFNGKVYVVTSNNTYSAAADFVSAFKYADRGLMIGDTVGQPYSGFIDKIPFKLPHSGLQGGVSFKKYDYIGANKTNYNQGIPPDIYLNSYKNDGSYDHLIEKIANSN